jgi:hypothetical protein
MDPFIELSTRLRAAGHADKLRQSSVQMSPTPIFLTYRHARSESCFYRNELLERKVDGHWMEEWHSAQREPPPLKRKGFMK